MSFDDEDSRSASDRADYLRVLTPDAGEGAVAWPAANSIKRGVAGEIPRVAEDAAAVIGRGQASQGLAQTPV